MYLNICASNEFLSCQKLQKMKILDFPGKNLHELELFHPYFECKCSFREISMIKIVILDQSKPISAILKTENSKI